MRKPWKSCNHPHAELAWSAIVDNTTTTSNAIENPESDIFSHPMHSSQQRELKAVILDGSAFHISANRIKYRIANLIIDRFDKKYANANHIVINNISKWEKRQIKKARVFYCNEIERSDYRCWIKEGWLLNKNNQKFLSDDYIFVLNKELNELYLGKKRICSQRGALQHSSFFSGGAISSAGYIRLEQDENQTIVRDLKMSSGHYRPSKQEAYIVLKFLALHDVDLSQTTIFKPYEKNTLKSKLYYALVDVARRKNYCGRISRTVLERARKERLMTGTEYIRYFEAQYADFAQLVAAKIQQSNSVDHHYAVLP